MKNSPLSIDPCSLLALFAILFITTSAMCAEKQHWNFRNPGITIESLEADNWSFSSAPVEFSEGQGMALRDRGAGFPSATWNFPKPGPGNLQIISTASGTTNITGNISLLGSDNKPLAGISYSRSNSILSLAKKDTIRGNTEGALGSFVGAEQDIFQPTPTAEEPATLEITWDRDLNYQLIYRVGNFDVYEEAGQLTELPIALQFSAGFNSAIDRELFVYEAEITFDQDSSAKP